MVNSWDRSLPGRMQDEISVTKALASAGDYAAEDVMSESASAGTAWIFNLLAVEDGARGFLVKAHAIFETTALAPDLTLYLFNALPTSALDDNVANTALLHADLANYIGRIEFPAMTDTGGDSEALVVPGSPATARLPLAFKLASGSKTLWGIVVTNSAITGEVATDDLTIRLTAVVQ